MPACPPKSVRADMPDLCIAHRRLLFPDMSTPTPPPTHSNQPPAAARPCLDPIALERLRELDPSGQNKLIERVLAAYLKSLDRLLPELAQARGEQLDLQVVRHVSHTLKSSSASLGALDLAERCAEIETRARNQQTEGMEALLDAMLDDIQQVRLALTALAPTTP